MPVDQASIPKLEPLLPRLDLLRPEDLAWYLASSEQVPSSVALGVELDAEGQVAAAGGLLVQAIPPGDEQQVEQLVERLQQLPPTTSLLRQGMSPAQILQQLFAGVRFRVQAEVPLRFYCPCNKAQIEIMLRGLGPEELQSLAEEEEQVAVTCEYCRSSYVFSHQEIDALF